MTELFNQCVNVFDAMDRCAEGSVYKGYLTYLFEDLELGVSRYTPVMRRLVAMGCVEQIAAGGRGSMSQWKMIARPTEALYVHTTNLRKRSRIKDLEARVEELEAWRRSQIETAAS